MTAPDTGSERQQQVVVVGPDGQPVGVLPMGLSQGADEDDGGAMQVNEMVEQPAKVMRIGTMIKQLLEEVRAAPLDEAGRDRLREIYDQSVQELSGALSDDLAEELNRLASPFGEDSEPSDAELRIAQAQLVGWLEGLFHGIQATLFAQQMAARNQLDQMRGQLPPGAMPGPGPNGAPVADPGENRPGTYL